MRKPNVRPWSQGDDNGLCGLYATVNAIRWLWPELRKKDKHGDELISPLPNWLIRYKLRSEQFKQLYLDGDELPLISKLVQWSVEWLRTTKGLEARFTYPFKLAPPSDKSTYWQRLLPLIEPRNVVGVIGFNDPYPHWTVATNQAGPHSVRLFDSDVFETVDMRRTVIGKTNGKTWEIDPTAVVIIDRIA
jgi:hypothetical protein